MITEMYTLKQIYSVDYIIWKIFGFMKIKLNALTKFQLELLVAKSFW